MRRSLAALCMVALIGLAACNLPRPAEEAPAASSPPVQPTAADPPVEGGEDVPGAEPLPPARPESEGVVLLPLVANQSAPAAGVEVPAAFDCAGGDPHPVGVSIAGTYAVPYEQVMGWFCSGYSFENILVALETGDAAGVPADNLLLLLQEKEWEEIWDELGFVEDR
jgi:hypothetical protein